MIQCPLKICTSQVQALAIMNDNENRVSCQHGLRVYSYLIMSGAQGLRLSLREREPNIRWAMEARLGA